MRWLLGMVSVLVFAFALVVFSSPIKAFVNEGWDWHLVDGQPKRTLHYCAGTAVKVKESGRSVDIQGFSPGLPPSWASWLTEAVNNLNNANAGWTLTPSKATFPPCQVLILLGDISENTHGGGVSTPRDLNGDGKADLSRIVIDQNLEETAKNVPENQDAQDGNRDGWSTIAGESTRDPIGTLMHELTHAMRLDHHPNSKHSDSSDSDISDPRKPGDHNTNLSDEDLAELRQASGTQEKFGRLEIPDESEQEYAYENVEFTIPANAFEFYPAMLDVNVYDGVAIPDPLAIHYKTMDGLDGNFTHVFGSGTIYFRTSSPLAKPITVKIPYTDEELEGGDNMYVGDLHDYVPPAVDENTMRAFFYVERPFGTEGEPPHWELIENSRVDTTNNQVVFETSETGIYGISGKERQGKSPTSSSLGESNKTVVSIIAGAAVGIVIYFAYRKIKNKKK